MFQLNSLRIAVLCSVLVCLALAPGLARADVVHPAYLNMQEIEPGRYDVVWKVPLRYGMRMPVAPLFPAHCKAVTDTTYEALPNAIIERWQIDCGAGGLDGETIEVAGLQATIMDVFIRIEMDDGRIYNELLRGAAPRLTVAPRKPFYTIASEHLTYGLRHIVRKFPVILLVFAFVLYAGIGWPVVAALASFAITYTVAFFGNAYGLIGTASGWGTFALGMAAFFFITGSVNGKLKTGNNETAPAAGKRTAGSRILWLAVLGLLFGAAYGGEWGGEGLAYLDIPAAGVALFIGVWLGLMLIAGVPIMTGIVHRDFNADRLRYAPLVPAYILGAAAVFFLLRSIGGLFPPGVVQPYLRPESLVLALAAGLWIGRGDGRYAHISAVCLLCAALAGLVIGVRGIGLAYASTAIPLSLAVLGIMLLLFPANHIFLGAVIASAIGLYHGWINGMWLAEHVNITLPSIIGEIILLAALLILGSHIRRWVALRSAAALDTVAGLGLLVGAFAIRFIGYRTSAFQEISVSASHGIRVPLVSLVLLVAVAVVLMRFSGRERGGVRASRVALPLTFLVVASLILVPYGGLAVTGGSSALSDLSDEETAALVAGLLENTYRAVNLKGEEEIYDRLSMSVHGDLVEKIYLESRRRSVMPSQSDREAKLIGVRIAEITDRAPAPDGTGYEVTCTWLVTGTIRHWAHKHNRLNRYVGMLTIRAVDDVWKISDLELLDEERL